MNVGRTGARAGSEAGFSLVEVLVAVMVFAVVSAISTAMLTTALRAREAHGETMAAVAELQRARALLREDFGQLVMRANRNREGARDGIVFAGDLDGVDPFESARAGEPRTVLAFTRAGWDNPGGRYARSSLQRVRYLYDGETLTREAFAYPDLARGAEPRARVLVAEARELEIAFLYGAVWRETARAASEESGDGAPAPPRAVRLRYVLPELGPVEHVLLTPAAEGVR